MKIEIEYEEVESLKRKISALQDELGEANNKLSMFDKGMINFEIASGIENGVKMLLSQSFKELGFDQSRVIDWSDVNRLKMQLGDKWYESDQIKVTLGAYITNEFRKAFLELGIKTQ